MGEWENNPELQEFIELNGIDLHGKNVVLFGTGEMSQLLSILPDYYVDNNEEKWGNFFKGRMVLSQQTLETEPKENTVILVASQYYTEIAEQLKSMGLVENQHFFDGKPLFEKEVKYNYRYQLKRFYRKTKKTVRRKVYQEFRAKYTKFRSKWTKYLKKRRSNRLKFGPPSLFPPAIGNLDYFKRVSVLRRYKRITKNIPCPHHQGQIISFVDAMLKIPPEVEGCIVEAGTFKGGSAAKFSIAARIARRKLYIFDSFEGLPENNEPHERSILGHSIKGWFSKGKFCGSLDEVKHNIKKYGHLDSCVFIKGWFEETMPSFDQKIVAAYIDVDLASSTKTCLKYLYPLLVPGGVLISQDGDFPLVIEVFDDDEFWEKEIGCKKPYIEGLGERKLIKIVKPNE